ncbi:MAG: hypothetical protein WC551_02570 [Patescibacteria group bacterium]
MGKKKKKLIEWQEEQKPVEVKREDIEKAFAKPKKRPMIRSSHR